MRGDIRHLKAPRDALGREQRGRRFAVVVQSDDLLTETLIIVPTSSSARDLIQHPMIRIDGTSTMALAEQVMAVSITRLGDVVGHATHREMADIDEALRLVLTLD